MGEGKDMMEREESRKMPRNQPSAQMQRLEVNQLWGEIKHLILRLGRQLRGKALV